MDSTYLGLESLGPSTWQEQAASYSSLERRIQVIMQTLGLEEDQRGSTEFESMADLKTVRPAVDRIEESVKKTNEQLNTEKKRLELLENQLRQIEPISHVKFEVGSLRQSSYLSGLSPG